MGCHGGPADFGGLTDSNGAAPGNIHGGDFTWPSSSFASGTQTEYFALGGWLGGWQTGTSQGSPAGFCRGGDCNHAKSSKNYSR